GRWVADSSVSIPPMACSPCPIPKKNLTLSWTNVLEGPGSTPLIFTPPGQWKSPCTNQLLYTLTCPGITAQFCVAYFISGSCPGGQPQTCCAPGFDPFALALTSYTCSPFFLHYTVTSESCAVLAISGYTSFTITE